MGGLAVGVAGALQALSWMTFDSAWAREPRGDGGLVGGLEVLGGKHGFGRCAGSLLRLLSGACLIFGALTLLLKYGLESGRIEDWDPRLVRMLLLHWFRLSAVSLAALAWAPLLRLMSRTATVHALLAMAGSALGWWALWDLLKAPFDEYWQVVVYLISWFPTYGCALLWGGALWWLPSRLAGKKA
jgi:hypothetical protein